MAISFYPADGIEIDVDDPGSGYLRIYLHVNDEPLFQAVLMGHRLWTALTSLTALACSTDAFSRVVDGLWSMTPGQARELLPAMQEAVVYAAAGGDRAERLTEDAAHDVLCVRCNEGSPFTRLSCDEYGHEPFGYPGASWERAKGLQADRNRWAHPDSGGRDA
jgi:hypothetical protein